MAAGRADRTRVGHFEPDGEAGFGLIELLISMVVLQVALLAIIGAFGAGAAALGRASNTGTAAALADQQMELYRSMTYEPIGLDTAGAPTTGMYVADTGACAVGLNPVCGNTAPRDNAGTATWSCTGAAPSVATYFTGSGVNPCQAHRTVTGTASPDGKTYYVDTYIKWAAASGQRGSKQITVIVRNAAGATLAKIVSTFDCATGQVPNVASC